MKKNVDPIEHYGNQINEAIGTTIAAILITAVGVRNLFKKLKDLSKEDAELQVAIDSYMKNVQQLKDTANRIDTEKKKRHTKK